LRYAVFGGEPARLQRTSIQIDLDLPFLATIGGWNPRL
jgi:hypothetical protein